MIIDLSQFVGKKVYITLRNGNQCKAHIQENGIRYFVEGEYLHNHFSYYCHYSKNGVTGPETDTSPFDIIKIEHHYTKPIKTAELPESTIEKIAEVLSPVAVKYIEESEEYVTFMSEMLTKFVREQVGNLNPEVEVELVTTMGSAKLGLKTVK